MDRWQGKIAVVTGASSGIGAAIVKSLINHQLIVVGLARRIERMEEMKNQLEKSQQNQFHAIKCDVANENDVKNAFEWVETNLGGCDILINSAGIFKYGQLISPESTENIKRTLDVNVMGIVYCTREAFKSMKKRDSDGHVILINSVAGHKIPTIMSGPTILNIYAASKYAVTAMTEVYRLEFADANTNVKITSISPGAVDTEIVHEQFRSTNAPMLKPEDISDATIYVLGTPPHVQVHQLIIKPLGEKF